MAENVNVSLPEAVRIMIRDGRLKSKPTSGYCTGFKQANIAIVHKSIAEEMIKFCEYNNGPLPLLGYSNIGQLNSELAPNANIKLDVPKYCVYKNGQETGAAESLKDFNLDEYVTFYIGCSFSFEKALQCNGIPIRNIEQNKNVSMFNTNIPCYGVGSFDCYMIVSYRPIPMHLLSLVTSITSIMSDVHGAPIHIGDPTSIGISDIMSPDYGDAVNAMPGDVPVFWCCGFTLKAAVISAKSELAFTHYPGCMFITDIPMPPATKCTEPCCKVVKISQMKENYSVVSTNVINKICSVGEYIAAKCESSATSEKLVNTSMLLLHSSSVALAMTDGIESHDFTGLISLGKTLQGLGKQVSIIVDESVHQICLNKLEKLQKQDRESHDQELQFYNAEEFKKNSISRFNVLLNLKTKQLVKKQTSYSENDVKHFLREASFCDEVELIDVSTWECYGLSATLLAIYSCPHHERYRRRAVGKPESKITKKLENILEDLKTFPKKLVGNFSTNTESAENNVLLDEKTVENLFKLIE